MTEEIQEVIPNELETLKNRANLMGIKYHPAIGIDKLRAKINELLEDAPVTKQLEKQETNKTPEFMTHEEFNKLSMRDRKRRVGSLIRIRVTCMNPAKKEWEGEIISVGSAKLGTFKKYIPFNTPDGWHVPYIIYEFMKDRKCSVFSNVKDHLGNKVRKARQINEFSIEVLPPLTKAELKDLAQRQAMSGSIDN